MKTIGEILSEARKAQKLKISSVSEKTKIRPRFIRAIEKNDFTKLSSPSTTYGFIKNYAQFLKVSPSLALAVFRRDWVSDKKGKIVPRGLVKPLDAPKFLRPDRIGFFFLTLLFIVVILVWLALQYFSISRGPTLEIITPPDQAKIKTSLIEVVGRTEPDASVTVNGELTHVSKKGEFGLTINLSRGKNTILVEAVNRLGKKRQLTIEIFRD
jgi:cytoskeletal protein RodZ